MARRRTKDQRPKTKDQRPKTKSQRSTLALGRWSLVLGRYSLVVGLALLLSGCLLVSGEQASSDTLPDGGNVSSSFVGADGVSERTIDTSALAATLNAIVIVQAERGELQVEVLNPDGSVAFAVKGRPEEQVTRQGNAQTDDQGQLRYRVIARGARNGSYQLLYQLAG